MVERASALDGHNSPRKFGIAGEPGVIMQDVRDLVLHQVAAWPDTIDAVAKSAAKAAGVKSAPGPSSSESGSDASLLRIEPLKWWIVGAEAEELDPEQGATLDISHSRTRIRVSGDKAALMLNRLLPLDLREDSFPVGSVASSSMHHVGITLWRTEQGYDIFAPRGFALACWEVMVETAAQFGGEVI